MRSGDWHPNPNRLGGAGALDHLATVDEIARIVELFAGPLGAGPIRARMTAALKAGAASFPTLRIIPQHLVPRARGRKATQARPGKEPSESDEPRFADS